MKDYTEIPEEPLSFHQVPGQFRRRDIVRRSERGLAGWTCARAVVAACGPALFILPVPKTKEATDC